MKILARLIACNIIQAILFPTQLLQQLQKKTFMSAKIVLFSMLSLSSSLSSSSNEGCPDLSQFSFNVAAANRPELFKKCDSGLV